MAYIGKEPADSFISFAKQDFTTSATTSYTLDNAVTNENELALFINFVRQEPTTAYTASGTTLTLTSATTSSDDMYCVYLGQAKQTVNAPDGSVGSSQVAASIITGQTAETSIATDDTVLIHDTSAGALRKMTRANFVSGVGGTNTPAFEATKNAQQYGISLDSDVKITYETEIFDTAGNFASSRFTPTTAGKYFVYCNQRLITETNGTLSRAQLKIFKNGSQYQSAESDFNLTDGYIRATNNNISSVIDMNGSSDYVEIYGQIGNTNGNTTNTGFHQDAAVFGAYKIIE